MQNYTASVWYIADLLPYRKATQKPQRPNHNSHTHIPTHRSSETFIRTAKWKKYEHPLRLLKKCVCVLDCYTGVSIFHISRQCIMHVVMVTLKPQDKVVINNEVTWWYNRISTYCAALMSSVSHTHISQKPGITVAIFPTLAKEEDRKRRATSVRLLCQSKVTLGKWCHRWQSEHVCQYVWSILSSSILIVRLQG